MDIKITERYFKKFRCLGVTSTTQKCFFEKTVVIEQIKTKKPYLWFNVEFITIIIFCYLLCAKYLI